MISFSLHFVPSPEQLLNIFKGAEAVLTRQKQILIENQGKRFLILAREEAPKKTGKFANSLQLKTLTANFTVMVPQPIGGWIMSGTQPHMIYAKNAKALRFEMGGRVIFAKYVSHPGTKPNAFMDRAYSRWLPGATTGLKNVAQEYSKFIAGAGR